MNSSGAGLRSAAQVQTTHRRIRRVCGRALAACALYALVALAIPRLIRGVGVQRERPRREEAPEYVMPNGERRRAVVITRPDAPRPTDARGDGALLWWCAILAAATLAGAAAQTMRIRADASRGAD